MSQVKQLCEKNPWTTFIDVVMTCFHLCLFFMSHYHGFDAQTNHTPSIAHTRVLFAFSISSSEGK